MIPQIVAIFLHLITVYNCVKALSENPDHKVKAEIAMILASSSIFCIICIYTLISYSDGEIDTLWQVYSVYNALTYAITTKRLSECSTTQNSSTN